MARALFLLLAALGLAPLAAAQDMSPDADPVSGTFTLDGGSGSSAFDVRAEAEVPVDGCVGYVGPSAPDVVVDWAGGDLRVWVRAAFDGTLAVHGPDGQWTCDDDTEGTSPVVEIADAAAGRYAVWLGSFSPSPFETAATLFAGAPPPPAVLGLDAAPLAGVLDAEGGFEAAQGAIEVTVPAGGYDDAGALDLGPDGPDFCSGYVDAARPTAAVAYDAAGGTGALVVAAYSDDTDLVLLVRTPGGEALCVDDFDGLNPVVVVEGAESGEYLVWVGTFSARPAGTTATLALSEEPPVIEFDDFDYDDFGQEPYTTGTYTPLDLDATPGARLAASDAEGASAEVSFTPTAQNPVSGGACTGQIETAPTAAVTLRGDGPFALTASADDDLTLTVRTPSGEWFCSDDASGLDPGVQIDAAEAGDYLVWVGTFAMLEPETATTATLSAQPGELVVSADADMAVGQTQSTGYYDGDALRAGGAATLIAFDGGTETVEVPAGGATWNPVEGDACAGYVSERPSLEVAADEGLRVAVSGDEDLTLVVRAPDGSWTCSDDASGTDPAATVYGGAGTYSVWVGTFFRRADATAEARVTTAPPPPAPPPPPPAPEVIRG